MSYLLDRKPSVETCTALTRELENLAIEARKIIEAVPGRNKFDLHVTHGWRELQASLASDRFANSLSKDALSRLNADCNRWMSLYRHLVFVASTRPVWNT